MKKKLITMLLGATVAISLIACGSSEVGSNEEELKQQIEELQQQLAEAQQGAKEEVEETENDSASDESSSDSETQSLINSINADTAEYQGVCGADAKWYYKDNVLVIKGTGEISDNPWQSVEYKVNGKYSERIFKINWVIIDEGITALSDIEAFHGIDELTKVVLPTSLEKIGASSFESCRNISNINIPSNVTEIGHSAFHDCKSLTSVNLPDGLTTIDSEAFLYCKSLTSINIPDSVTTIGYSAFTDCISLEASTIEKIQSINADGFGYSGNTSGIYDTEQ